MRINVHYILFLWMFSVFMNLTFNEVASLKVFAGASQLIPFQWTSCGNSSDVVTIKTLDVYQNGSSDIFVTGEANVKYDIESPISGTLDMKKKFLGIWIPVPCVGNFGTCSYSDVCALSPYKTDCPQIYKDNNLPCRCPIRGGSYSMESLPIDLTVLPKWIENGLYHIRVLLTSAGKQILCLKMAIDVEIVDLKKNNSISAYL